MSGFMGGLIVGIWIGCAVTLGGIMLGGYLTR